MENSKIVPVEDFEKEVRVVTGYTQDIMENLKNIFRILLNLESSTYFNQEEKNDLKNYLLDIENMLEEYAEFLKISEYRSYITTSHKNRTLRLRLFRLKRVLLEAFKACQKVDRDIALLVLDDVAQASYDFSEWLTSYKIFLNTQILHDRKIESLNKKIKASQAELQRINSQRTELIYSQASKNYLETARIYEWSFYLIFFAAILVTIVSLVHFPYGSTDIVDYVLYKVLTVSIIVTTGTIFLRKASHLRKLHDQANQTSLELQALPLYLRNVDEAEHSVIYKNLAEKYFGKEIDQTQNDKVGDLMKDQLAAGTELIKASAEMVKNVKTLSTSVDKTISNKPNNTSAEDKTKSEGDG
ncbi:hypothetical protein [Acinetobacter sp. BWR-L5]|uniref:hypothetical protein n=1 Tax=Acinetobacter sp. BWR-L5 TaxID=2815725 RepID=UPI0031FE7A22